MTNLIISLAQINIQLGRPDENLELARSWTTEAARRGSQLLLLPELWTTGYDLSNAHALAKKNVTVMAEIADLADEFHIAIGGSLLLEREGKVYNTFVFQSPGQEKPDRYDKIHLFRLMEEDRWLAPGDHLQCAQAPWGTTGLSICYDLRFPEMFRRYALSGSSLFLICAEWPSARAAHWQTLLRARAIENQCFIAATNCVGPCGGENFAGQSAVISPWGEALVEGSGTEAELLTASFALEQAEDIRQQIPILKDRRPDLYG